MRLIALALALLVVAAGFPFAMNVDTPRLVWASIGIRNSIPSTSVASPVVVSPGGRWSSAFPWPPSPFAHSMAYDSRTGQVVSFGGTTTTGYIDTSIWVYDYQTNTWTNRNPLPHPSPRVRAALVYDSESDRFVLYGGINAMLTLNETWVYDLNNDRWTLMHPLASPLNRYWHAMAYDQSADRVILFGGSNGVSVSSTVSDETWAYDFNTNTWTNRNPSVRPAARAAHAMAYDSVAHRTILHGGNVGAASWAYDFASNVWTQLATGPARVDPALAYDAQSDRIVLFGGDSSPYDPPTGDTWSFDYGSNTWTQMAPSASPPHVAGIPMVYDPVADRTVLFPDYYDPTPNYDPTDDVRGGLWAYDFESDAWSPRLSPPHPGFRSSFGFAFDEQSSRAILFGGTVAGSTRGDTWAYDPMTMAWTPLFPSGSPSARRDLGMGYASRHDRIVLFGGNDGSLTESDETWLFDYDQNTWSNPNPSPKPPVRRSPGLAYDSGADRVVLFGGVHSDLPYVHLGDTWTYDVANNTWANVTPGFSPAPREGHSMAYAAQSGKVVLFGGFNINSFGKIGNETWVYDLRANNWTRVEPLVHPTPRWLASMAYDAAADRVILFGGVPPGGACCTFFDDTWSYDVANATWVQLDVGDHPGGLYGHGLTYDSPNDRVLLYGGAFDDSTWSYAYASPVPPGPVVWYDPRMLGSTVQLSWFVPEYTGGAAVLSYRVYRGTSPENAAYLATSNVQAYADGRLESGVTYYYYVRAVNAAGEGASSGAFVVLVGGPSAAEARLFLLIGIPTVAAGIALGTVLFFILRRRRPPKDPSTVQDAPR